MNENNRKNIVLIGFMGTGKTTISNALKEMCAMRLVDTDCEIEKREGRTIAGIFAADGEEYFRNQETKLLEELQAQENLIISCGGGTPLRDENIFRMKTNGEVFLLSATPETIYERVKDSHERPILEGRKTAAFIEELLESRRQKYEAAADYVIETDGKNVKEICEEIISKRRS